MTGTASNVYEAHLTIVKELGEKVLKEAKRLDSNAAKDLRDVAVAYATAVDKLATFNQNFVLADGSGTVPLKDRL